MSFLDFKVEDLPVYESNYELLPAGWYAATINGAELKSTKTGAGQYISLACAITGPTHQGRTVFGNLNIKNPNPKAEEIGRQDLGAIMRAIGLARVTDTDQLIGGQLSIKIKIRPGDGQYEATNEINGYKALDGGIKAIPTAAASQQPSVATPPPTVTSAGTAPWLNK